MSAKELLDEAKKAKTEANTESAINILNKLIDEYPDSPEAETARAIRYNLNNPTNQETEILNVESIVKNTNEVVVTDIQMPFGSMVVFMVKWAIASIPAMIILFILIAIISAIFGGIFSGFMSPRY